MEKSIESIWKEGILTNQMQNIPRVNNLYNQRSNSAVDQLINHMRMEMWALIPLAILTFIMSSSLGNNWIASLLPIPIFGIWFYIAYSQLKSMKEVPYDANCYEYLLNVKGKMDQITNFNRQLSVLSVAVLLTPMLIYTYLKQGHKSFGEIFGWEEFGGSSLLLFAIIPIVMLFAYLFFNLMARFIGNKIGSKIEQLIKDLEQLRD